MLSRHTAPVSFDLMLLDPDTVPTIEGIYEVLESDAPEVPLTTRMQAAIDECSSRWPAYDEAGNEIETPWASWPLARAMETPRHRTQHRVESRCDNALSAHRRRPTPRYRSVRPADG